MPGLRGMMMSMRLLNRGGNHAQALHVLPVLDSRIDPTKGTYLMPLPLLCNSCPGLKMVPAEEVSDHEADRHEGEVTCW